MTNRVLDEEGRCHPQRKDRTPFPRPLCCRWTATALLAAVGARLGHGHHPHLPPPLEDNYNEIDGEGSWPLSLPSANDVTRGKGGIRRRRWRQQLTRGGRLGERALTSGALSGRSLPTSGGGSAVVVVRTGQRRAQGQQQRRGVGQRQRGWGRWTTEWAHNNQPSM